MCAAHHEKALFLRFFKVIIDHLFDNLSLEKVLNFGSKNLYNAVCVRKLEVVSELKTYCIMQIVTILY